MHFIGAPCEIIEGYGDAGVDGLADSFCGKFDNFYSN
jgi:hypothetical protein